MLWRILLSMLILFVTGASEVLINSQSTLILGQAAGAQFMNSDAAYVGTQAVFHAASMVNMLIGAGVFFAMIFIWGPLVMKLGKEWLGVGILLFVLLSNHPDRAFAFAETTDRTEVYSILPNESAFWIPSNGANKDSQAQLDSEDYLKANKIAAKLFQIPHSKLTGTGGIGWVNTGWSDYYVPTGKLIIVDRTPYSREWVASKERGTSNSNQGQYCQSSEGLNITAGVAIGTSVSESDAAKFLYNFGVVTPKGDRTDVKYIFFPSIMADLLRR